jgi:NDP-sugar pyrophosphorylase family protein
VTPLPPVAILAGGLATRLGDHARSVPKALVEVAGAPFAFHQLRLLASHGAREIVYCVGHLGDQIEAAVGDGARFGLVVRYAHDGPGPRGTLGALRGAAGLLGEEFLVLYGDTYLRIDYGAVAAARRDRPWPALMTVLRNAGRWDRSNTAFDGERVLRHDKRAPSADLQWIDYGLGAWTAAALEGADPAQTDLSEAYGDLAAAGRLGGFEATERFYEIGTPAALAETGAFLRTAGRASG